MKTPQERFWEKVDKTDTCWNWTGAGLKGYGRFSYKGEAHYATRVVWEWVYGPITDGLHVLHTCHNPACVRVDHLYLGTPADNAKDRLKDGTQVSHEAGYSYWAKGEAHPRSKLTEDQVREIRRLWAEGGIKKMDLVRKFGMSHYAIRQVLNGHHWGHVT